MHAGAMIINYYAYFLIDTVVANVYERVHIGYLRSWAVSECLTQIRADDCFTHCISIGPVSCAIIV